ncbi:thioredoxin-dependent thiol peroxidase [Paenibacillus chitinolyticus]|uniref:thioredoxin-dependent peroxiredoxin n=1 Tax=Paenibacillus chitinolyticus TaxID=79263 RepID=A0A410X3L1_9BACL|nr:thioredoxin-dependent thiol peroxidase [Paenibacillus chitinolyticus]MCY9593156.1 thioredoxin-dependent thiol peroxidase [Paenibacillus chitinolyticus]MCY9595327.1 thioredoxin-dependent thiol peroxidase [Paenibacillus chitinolyticus]QAV21199.1 thioredoxin-dependent thiol peroxidase [Paenibacillus chitinolyticus]
MSINTGQQAPDFELPANNGQQVKLSDFKEKKVVLYFYPKDMTPACTTQACDFRDKHPEFESLNAVILGVSTDSLKRHEKFIDKYSLPFLLLADEDHAVSEIYGVWKEKSMYGKTFMGIERSTFLIDEEGVLVKEWRKVKVKGHIEEALTYLKEH